MERKLAVRFYMPEYDDWREFLIPQNMTWHMAQPLVCKMLYHAGYILYSGAVPVSILSMHDGMLVSPKCTLVESGCADGETYILYRGEIHGRDTDRSAKRPQTDAPPGKSGESGEAGGR